MASVLEALYRWQELAGAILGGIFALLVAFIVARDARFRAERTAAMTVTAALLRVRASYLGARDAIRAKSKTADDEAFGLAAALSIHPPLPPDHFSQAVVALLDVHPHIAAHLSIIDHVFGDVRHALERWMRDQEDYSRGDGRIREPADAELPRAKGDMLIDARTIVRGMAAIHDHSNCVVRLLDVLVLSRFRAFHRLRLWLVPNAIERVCADALRTGEFPGA